MRAGLIPDPYYELNSLQCEWVKDRWWMYKTSFRLDPSLQGRHLRVHFKGIDYKAHISLNGKLIGESEAMFLPFKYDITNMAFFDKENQLSVLLESAPDEMGQIGITSKVTTQKSRFTYKWDFSARLIHLGLYDEVLIEDFGPASIEEAYIRSQREGDEWFICGDLELNGYEETTLQATVEITLDHAVVCTDTMKVPVTLNSGNRLSFKLPIREPRIWYPNGRGDHPLYTVEVSLYHEGVLSDKKTYHVGLRTLEFERTEGALDNALPYVIKVNGRRMFIKGVNIVPLDQIYGGVDYQRYDRMISQMVELGINFIRVWGGGFIETDYFYDLCSRNGILVWQDFLQSSSGLCNAPSLEPAYLDKLEAVSLHAIKEKRNHTSLAVWCGGNELRETPFTADPPITMAHPVSRLLSELVKRYDPSRLYLPSTASGLCEFMELDTVGRQHDTHGPWSFQDAQAYYAQYNTSTSMLYGENGAEGLTNYTSMKHFLSEENLRPSSMKENVVWKNHGDWWCTAWRDKDFFGPFAPDEMIKEIACSQYIQGEAIRYAYETARRRMFHCAGDILWQFTEPWPNVSCTNLVDYYGNQKWSYLFAMDALKERKPMLQQYTKLEWKQDENFTAEYWFANDGEACEVDVKVEVLNWEGHTIKVENYHLLLPDNGALHFGSCRVKLADVKDGFSVRFSCNENRYMDYLFFMDGGDKSLRKERVYRQYVEVKQRYNWPL